MSVHTPLRTSRQEALPPYGVRPGLRDYGLVTAVPLFFVFFLGLPALGLPAWQSGLWALAYAVLAALGVRWGEGWARWLPRLAFAAAPLLGYTLVEALNYNNAWTSFPAVQVLLNLVWYYMISALVYLLVGRLTLSAGVSAGLFLFIGLANRYIIRFRGRTIFPGDLLTLRTAVNVASKYDYGLDQTQLISLLVLGLFLLVLWKLPRRSRGRKLPRLRVILPTAAACLLYLGAFFQTDMLRVLDIEPSLWTTRGNGFLLNFSVCLRYSTVDEPEGYDPDALAAFAAQTVPSGDVDGQKPVNVIAIMNESFSDLAQVLDLETNEDPMPFFHSLEENTVRGTAYASVFGGTTANSEYEFLTGNTTAFLPEGTVPFQMYVTPGAPGLGGQMKALGYETIFFHPYLASGWNRRAVYQNFGFDQIYFQDAVDDPAYMRRYITDQSSYEKVVELYEAKEEGEPLFLFNVTMQNHSAYNVPWEGLDKTVWLTGSREGRYRTVDQYLSLLRQSDNALQYLIEYFQNIEEPTMLVLFGDHQPQVATNFYTDVLGGEFADLPAAVQQKKQAVPFLIWANYDIPEEQGIELSLNYLSTLLVETANLPATGYQQFLSQLRQTVPAVNAVGCRDTDGTWVKRRGDLSQAAQDALLEYESFQYNQLFDDEENRLTGFFTLPQTETEENP